MVLFSILSTGWWQCYVLKNGTPFRTAWHQWFSVRSTVMLPLIPAERALGARIRSLASCVMKFILGVMSHLKGLTITHPISVKEKRYDALTLYDH